MSLLRQKGESQSLAGSCFWAENPQYVGKQTVQRTASPLTTPPRLGLSKLPSTAPAYPENPKPILLATRMSNTWTLPPNASVNPLCSYSTVTQGSKGQRQRVQVPVLAHTPSPPLTLWLSNQRVSRFPGQASRSARSWRGPQGSSSSCSMPLPGRLLRGPRASSAGREDQGPALLVRGVRSGLHLFLVKTGNVYPIF